MKTKGNAKIALTGLIIIIGLMALFSGLARASDHQDTLDGYYKPLPTKPIKRTKVTYSLVTLIDGIICVEGITESGGVDLDCDFTEYHKIQERKALEGRASLWLFSVKG